jgi:hypothetical protein
MAGSEARAWWSDVEHLRERFDPQDERRVAPASEQAPASRGRPVDRRVRTEDGRQRDVAETLARTTRSVVTARRSADGARSISATGRGTVRSVSAEASDGQQQMSGGPARRRSGAVAPQRRPRPRGAQRIGPDPDRLALWAFAFALLALLAAAISAHGL